ncbi:MAG TPA: hypothetical protein PKE63_13425 [Lacibacter sp.]|nr:hypothetical protein [Lacibacter sp.]HMO88227.1 hypothetical protein [Lacibacter sp.]HMP88274.1 hypothetical protein [Lacibacter sp.]
MKRENNRVTNPINHSLIQSLFSRSGRGEAADATLYSIRAFVAVFSRKAAKQAKAPGRMQPYTILQSLIQTLSSRRGLNAYALCFFVPFEHFVVHIIHAKQQKHPF